MGPVRDPFPIITPSAAIAELVQTGEVEFGLSVVQTNRWDLNVETISASPLVLTCPAGRAGEEAFDRVERAS